MKVNGIPYRSLWPTADGAVEIIDQRSLPYAFATRALRSVDDVDRRHLHDGRARRAADRRGRRVRPRPGHAARRGRRASRRCPPPAQRVAPDRGEPALGTRPPARRCSRPCRRPQRADAAWLEATRIADEDVELNRAIGAHGARLIAAVHARTGGRCSVLTHCNAGWLATVDFGTALSAIYQAHDAVDPGARLGRRDAAAQPGTADGLGTGRARRAAHVDRRQRGRPPDAARRGRPRAGRRRPRERARRRREQDRHLPEGTRRERQRRALLRGRAVADDRLDHRRRPDAASRSRSAPRARCAKSRGLDRSIGAQRCASPSDDTPVANPAFDVTPARLVTGIVTERGVVAPGELGSLFPERRQAS